MIMSSVNTTVGDGVIGQSINGLLCKHDLSSILTLKKSQARRYCLQSQPWGDRDRWVPGTYWPFSLVYLLSSRLVKRPACPKSSKKKGV